MATKVVSPVTGSNLYNFLSLVVKYKVPSVSNTVAVKVNPDLNIVKPKPSEGLILINVEAESDINFSNANI